MKLSFSLGFSFPLDFLGKQTENMEGEELRRSEADAVDLLNQFERFLESDPQM